MTKNAARNPRKIQSFELVPISASSNVPCEIPNAITDASISSEPTIVYSTNVTVAFTRCGPPQTPTST